MGVSPFAERDVTRLRCLSGVTWPDNMAWSETPGRSMRLRSD
jgi:hypothetical protein